MGGSSEMTARIIRANTLRASAEQRGRQQSEELLERVGRYVTVGGGTGVAASGGASGGGQRGVVTRAASTAMDVVNSTAKGAWRGVEGIVDAAVNVVSLPVTAVVDWITGAESRRAVREFIERDWVGEIYEERNRVNAEMLGFDWREQSYQQGWLGEQLRAIEEGIGGMLPAVAVTAATGGAGAPALLTTGVQAAGQGMQEAYRDGASDMGGLAYGVTVGAAEAGVEKLTGGVSKYLYGAGLFDDILPMLPRNLLTRTAGTFVGEGLEEAITEAANPLMKTTYRGADALTDYTDPEQRRELIGDTVTSFLQGGATAVAFAGTVGYGMARAGGGHTGREANVNELIEDIEGLRRKETNLRRAYKLTPERDADIAEQVTERYRDIQKNLQAVSPERRARMLETFSLEQAFDKDGNFTEDFRRRLGIDSEGEPTESAVAEPYSYRAMVEKPDMALTVVDDTPVYEANAETRKRVIDEAIKNAASVGRLNENGNAVVHVNDIDTDVIVGKNGIRHGLDRRLRDIAPVALNIGSILKNSVRINELAPRSENIKDSYVLIGAAKTADNRPYVVEFVVNRHTSEITSVDVLYSVNAKHTGIEQKNGADRALAPGVPAETDRLTDPAISIAQLLEFVNRYFPDILPRDVLSHFGREERPEGALGGSVRYSEKEAPRKSIGADNGTLGRKGEASYEDSIAQKEGNVKPSAKKLHPEFFKGDSERVRAALESAGLEAVTDMESLSAEERASYRQLLVVTEKLDGLTGGQFDFVITEASEGETGAYSRRNDVIMISREVLKSPEATARALYDSWFGVMLEETLHMMSAKVNVEHANAYTELWHLMRKDSAAVNAVADKLIELGYLGKDRRAARREIDHLIHEAGKEGAELTDGELARYGMILDELIAHLGRDKLSTQHFFERMIKEDKSAAERFLEAIRGLKNRKRGKGAVEAEIDLEALRLEGVFLEAVRECGGEVDDTGRIVGVNDEEEETITEGGVRYSIIRRQYPQNSIQKNMEELADTESVYQVDSKKLEKSGRKPSEIYTDYFKQWGENIYTEEFGDIALKPSSVKSEIRHGTTSEKIATIEAIPAVLKQGKVIFSATKQGDVERIVVAAPISIGEDGYYMGVMLQRDSQNQRLYLHNVVAEKETATASVWSLTNRTDGSESDCSTAWPPTSRSPVRSAGSRRSRAPAARRPSACSPRCQS